MNFTVRFVAGWVRRQRLQGLMSWLAMQAVRYGGICTGI